MKFDYLPVSGKSVCIGKGKYRTCVQFADFPVLYTSFVKNISNGITLCVEQTGAKIMGGEINKDSDIYNKFIFCVCLWGGGLRVWGNLPRHNGGNAGAQKNTGRAVKQAVVCLQKSDIKSAIEIMRGVKGFGMSYASKVLRMLAPDKAAAFDSRLTEAVGQNMTDSAYPEWCAACAEMAKILRNKGIKNIARASKNWKAADVEAVIFNEVRNKIYEINNAK